MIDGIPGSLRRVTGVFLILIILAMGSALLASCTFDLDYDKYAIVYGISEYINYDDLDYTDDDAWEVAELLAAQGFQVIRRITDDGTVTDPDGPTTPNIDEASYQQLYRDFQNVAAQADMYDLFVFYFSGHGGPDTTSSGTEEVPGSDQFDEVVALVDDTLGDEKLVRDDELADLLRTIPCARRIVIIDACYSGGFIGNPLEADAIPPDYTDGSNGLFEIVTNTISLYSNFQDYGSDISPSDALVIAAAGEREYSWESGTYQNGIMTYFLLESAKSGDANGDGYITVSESYYYVYRNINKNFNATAYSLGYDVYFPHTTGGAVDYILFTK